MQNNLSRYCIIAISLHRHVEVFARYCIPVPMVDGSALVATTASVLKSMRDEQEFNEPDVVRWKEALKGLAITR